MIGARKGFSERFEDLFGPQHRFLFSLRIRTRIRGLQIRLWWHRPKLPLLRLHWRKPFALLVVGILTPLLLAWLLARFFPRETNGFLGQLHDLLTSRQGQRLEWREASQLLLVIIGIPIAFLLWLFRDMNITGTLENQRKDVNLKEFHEIQMRAAGAMDEKLAVEARETLQIAALHQMRSFLRGEYGRSFRRPAFELIRARFSTSAKASGTEALREKMSAWRKESEAAPKRSVEEIRAMAAELRHAVQKIRSNSVAQTERSILKEEWESIFRANMPLARSTFDRAHLGENMLLAGVDLVGCRFIGSTLFKVHMEYANLFNADFASALFTDAHLEWSELTRAHFEGARFFGVRMDYAQCERASFQGASLYRASFHGANLEEANLEGAHLVSAVLISANLKGASLRHANLRSAVLTNAILDNASLEGAVLAGVAAPRCTNATFDEDTEFALNWSQLSEEKRTEARRPWIVAGATPVRAISDAGTARPMVGP